MVEYDEVRTNDVALVAYLKLKGHTAMTVAWKDGICNWTFNGMAVDDATDFLTDNALVNPRDYTKYFGQAKREMQQARQVRV
jgi:hypothetical protein